MALTLVPADLARPGHAFTFTGANAGGECSGCPFTRLCFGLGPGRHYVVRSVRQVVHPCGLHEPGKVRVVEVEESPFVTTVESRRLRGTAVTWSPIACARPECGNYGLCHPHGPKPQASYAVVRAEEGVDCPAGYALSKAHLRRMPS